MVYINIKNLSLIIMFYIICFEKRQLYQVLILVQKVCLPHNIEKIVSRRSQLFKLLVVMNIKSKNKN